MTILQEIDKFESKMDQLIKSIIDKLPSEKIEENKPVEESIVEAESVIENRSKNEQDDYDRLVIKMNERWKRLDEEKQKSEEIRPVKRFKTNREDFDSDYAYMSDGW